MTTILELKETHLSKSPFSRQSSSQEQDLDIDGSQPASNASSSSKLDAATTSSSTLTGGTVPKKSGTLTNPANQPLASSASTSSLASDSSSTKKPGQNSSSTPINPGTLVVSVTNAVGLSLPPGYQSNPLIQNYMNRMSPSKSSLLRTPMISSSTSNSTGNSTNASSSLSSSSSGACGSSAAGRRRMPVFLVMEFDKNQVVLEATGGPLETPTWDTTSNFDVSRSDTITFQIYTRIPLSHQQTDPQTGLPPSRKYEEIFLGTCKIPIDPSQKGQAALFNSGNPVLLYDGLVPLSGGSGRLNVRLEYRPNRKKGLTIDDFDLLKVVGKGSFGKVMQVRKKDTLQIYALKTIRKSHIVSRSEVNHTLAERTVLAQIDNPFIVPLKFSFQSPEKLYFVLAFINGGELFHHLQNEGKFDLNRSRFYTAELLCALECLHEYNVIYRDLKPENILLDYTGHIALCDFGLCKLNMVGQEKTNTFCGTPEYLAPELLLGQGYTKVVDWWTLGVLFYEMLTGLPPFYDENVNEMYRKILQDPLRFPDDMDREACSLLTGLLERDPTRRLGVNGAADIKNHPFFAQIDWRRLMAKKYAAPFKPAVESATDTSNFDSEFTSEVPADSVVEDGDYLSESVQKQFGGWTYTSDSKLASSGNW